MRHINNFIEPQILYLVWQGAGTSSEKRKKRVVGHIYKNELNQVCLKYLYDTEDYVDALKNGFEGYSAFDVGTQVHINVLDIFMRRLPPRSRRDFKKYLNSIRIRNAETLSDFTLLGYTQAKSPSDGFTIVNPFDGANQDFEFLTEVAGTRYHCKSEPTKDSKAELILEDNNKYDPKAVRIDIDGNKVGYLNRFIATRYREWITTAEVKAYPERFYYQHNYPYVWLYISVKFK